MMETRLGEWMPTYSGGRFYPRDPRPEEVKIEDIAHQLALINRFGGTSRVPLSVAEHSVRVSLNSAPNDELWGLLHDAHEAYTGVDVPRPVKVMFPEWQAMERRIQDAVCDRFGLPREMPFSVREADERLLITEARDVASNRNGIHLMRTDLGPLPERIDPWGWEYAERRFIHRFMQLTRHSVVP